MMLVVVNISIITYSFLFILYVSFIDFLIILPLLIQCQSMFLINYVCNSVHIIVVYNRIENFVFNFSQNYKEDKLNWPS